MRSTSALLILAALPASVSAQSLLLPTAPVPAGSTVSALVLPAPGSTVCANSGSLFIMSDEGDLVSPRFHVASASWSCASGFPGLAMSIQVPSAGPGSSGSFVAYFPYPPGLAGRLDVGTPSPSFPAIHTYPSGIYFGVGGHTAFPDLAATTPSWCLVNTSASPHTFGPGDVLKVCEPGNATPVATTPLAGLQVPAGGRTMIPLPTAGMAPAPYTVKVSWIDPAVGPTTRTIGIHASTIADLHVPTGRRVPLGGYLEAYMEFQLPAGPAPLAMLLIGMNPGSTPIGPNEVIPLVADPLVMLTLQGGLGSLLVNSPATPAPLGFVSCGGYCAPTQLPGFILSGIRINHPGALLSGTHLRIAGMARDATSGIFVATQGEDIVLQ